MKKTAIAVATLALLASHQTQAAGNPFYIGLSYGQTDVETGISNPTGTAVLDDEDSGYKLFAGYDFNKNVALEVHYADLGEASLSGNPGDTFVLDGTTFAFLTSGRLSVEAESLGISGVFKLPVSPQLTPYARLGLHKWDLEASVTSALGTAVASNDGTDPFYGIGIDFAVSNNFAIRAEYERFDFDGDDLDMLSIGASLRF